MREPFENRLSDPGRPDPVRAAQRAQWAATALHRAAEDLREAGSGDTTLDGLAEMVLVQAGLVSRMAEDIDSRKQQDDAASAKRR